MGFNSINERKVHKHAFWGLSSVELVLDTLKKVPSLVSLTASIMFNKSFVVEKHICWAFEWNVRSGESNDSETIFIGAS